MVKIYSLCRPAHAAPARIYSILSYLQEVAAPHDVLVAGCDADRLHLLASWLSLPNKFRTLPPATALHDAGTSSSHLIASPFQSAVSLGMNLGRLLLSHLNDVRQDFQSLKRSKTQNLQISARISQERSKVVLAMVEAIPMHDVVTERLSVDAELAKSGSPPGYPQVADFMGEFPTLAMVHRFRGINACNLLYLQA